MNDIIDSAVSATPEATPTAADAVDNTVGGTVADTAGDAARTTEPGPDDLRWAEEMFEEWQRLLSEVHHPAGSSTVSGLSREQ